MHQTQIAIQVDEVSFALEGVEQVLENVQSKGEVDTLFLSVACGRSKGNFAREGQRMHVKVPEHCGPANHDDSERRGTRISIPSEDLPARERGRCDFLGRLFSEARQRGLQCYASIDVASEFQELDDTLTYSNFLEEGAQGRRGANPCLSNTQYCEWHLGMVEEMVRRHHLDGVGWGSEQRGPAESILQKNRSSEVDRQPICFCRHCRTKAAELGINVERARTGILKLQDFMLSAGDARRPPDGYFVTFWRLLIQYPEILQWERFWHTQQQELYKGVCGRVKAVASDVRVGWHASRMNSFSPFCRAAQDMADIARYSDFIRVTAFSAGAGSRFADFIQNLHSTIFRDAPKELGAAMIQAFLGIDEGTLDEGVTEGWSAESVGDEAYRALAAVTVTGTNTAMLAGIDINTSFANKVNCFTGRTRSKVTEPQDVYEASLAALEAGAHGLVLSGEYSEMPLANLEAAGDAVRKYRRLRLA